MTSFCVFLLKIWLQSYAKMFTYTNKCRLFDVINLDDDNLYMLVVSVIGYLGYVPVAWEEDEEFSRSTIVEACFFLVVVVVYHVGFVAAVGRTGIVVDDAETFCALHYILEVDVVIMAFTPAFGERCVLRFFHANGQVAAWYGVLAFGEGGQVGLGKIGKQGLPLLWIFFVLEVEIYSVDTGVRIGFIESVTPFAGCQPFVCASSTSCGLLP